MGRVSWSDRGINKMGVCVFVVGLYWIGSNKQKKGGFVLFILGLRFMGFSSNKGRLVCMVLSPRTNVVNLDI